MADDRVINPGPLDPSLLYKQSEHISERVWAGDDDRILRVRWSRDSRSQNQRLMNDVPDEIVPYLRQAGFYECSKVVDIPPDHQLLSALIERWRSETHTFHFRVGECTITLQDVAVQLGLRIDGRAVTGCVVNDWKSEIQRLLGKSVTDNDLNGNRLKMTWINANFHNYEEHRHDEASRVQYARAYILRLMGGVLFPDSSGNEVALRYLPYLEDFNVTASYSWGSAVLAYLYHAMCDATYPGRTELIGWLKNAIFRINNTVPPSFFSDNPVK